VRWYRKAAKQGLPEALYNVAIAYYNGEGIVGDMVASYAWMMVALDKGDEQAAEALLRIGEQLHNRLDRSKFELAELYEKGEEVPQNLPAAASLYLEVAKRGYQASAFASPAQYKLCQLYVAGKGVPKDYAQAKSWCKKSGEPFAYVIMGRMAEKGLGQQKDLREAVEYYKRAAIDEVPDGYMDTGRVKMEMGSHKEEKNAYFWYYLAAERKIPGADAKLRESATHLNEKEIAEQQKQAAAWEKATGPERENNLKKH